MKKTLPFLTAFFLLLTLTFAIWQYEKTHQPEKYIFQYESIVPSGGINCDQDMLASILTGGDELGETRRAQVRISEKTIKTHGPEVFEYIKNEFQIVYDQRAEKLQDILNKMTPYLKEPNLDFHIHLLNSTMVNAFTAIGNNLFFTTALYDLAENDDERAMVIGHELGHQENGHVYEIWKRIEQWKKRLKGEILGYEYDLSEYADIIGLIEDIISTPFGQPDEKEADLAGAYLTYKAGYDPEIGVGIFHKFKDLQNNPSTGIFLRLLSSHPLSQERISCLDNYIAAAKLRAENQKPTSKDIWGKLAEIITSNNRATFVIALLSLVILVPVSWSLTNDLRLSGPSFLSISALARL